MIGRTISHYKIVEKLGQGGMGVVYKAEDTRLNRIVAIKFLSGRAAPSDEERERFTIEAKAAAALNHPHIATIHAIEESDGELFIVMEYVEGEELKKRLSSGPLSPAQATAIAAQIAEGLKAAHDKGIVHRDIKSANIMLAADGQVKIMDFGLAKMRGGAQVTKAGSTVGTSSYMSPEQTRGEEVDQRSDCWSLGVVLYEMLEGRLPFAGEYEHAVMYAILNEAPPPLASLRPGLPPKLTAIVDRALRKDPAARYQGAAEMLSDLRAVASPAGTGRGTPFRVRVRKPIFFVPAAAILVAAAFGVGGWMRRNADVKWARETAIPEIERVSRDGTVADGQSAWTAAEIARKVEEIVPDDPLFVRLKPRFLRTEHIFSLPTGAKMYAKPYSQPSSEWRYIGQTPIDGISFPLGFSRVKLELPGLLTAYDIAWNSPFFNDTLTYKLADPAGIPEGMEPIPAYDSRFDLIGEATSIHLPGLEAIEPADPGSFLMDRYEVTNKEYKAFIDAGGYKKPEYWTVPVMSHGHAMSHDAEMKLFVDKTGRPGPSTWEAGDYPAGNDDYPVSGVSWYEAAAYAAYAGKSLPTIFHFDRVAFTWASPVIVPASNLRGSAAKKVGSSDAINRFGVYDLGGNVREWCVNETNRGDRFILGGGWNDPAYAFNDAYAQSPLDRTETNGFRCIKYIAGGAPKDVLEKPIVLPFRDFLHERSVNDETFALFRRQYSYDKSPLNARVESTTDEPDWRKEKVSFDAAYGGERMTAYLLLPKKGKPPYQTVVYFPGSGAIHTRSSESLGEIARLDFIVKSGRAVIFPVYKSTFERGDALDSDYPTETNFWKDHVIMWAKDCSRSIDYLETRPEIDHDKIAYYGASWGGAMGGIIPAVEPRIKLNILLVAGLLFQKSLPEAEPVNFLPHIKTPVLMLNGKYDFFFPYETSQRPFYELLGTPKEEKKMLSYEGGHGVPRTQLVKEALDWLDHYFGATE